MKRTGIEYDVDLEGQLVTVTDKKAIGPEPLLEKIKKTGKTVRTSDFCSRGLRATSLAGHRGRPRRWQRPAAGGVTLAHSALYSSFVK